MKKLLVISMVFLTVALLAESFSFESPAGNFKVSVEENNSNTKSKTSIADEIAKRVEYLQSKYLNKLNAFDQKKSDKVVDQIYELLALLPEDIYVTQENTQSSQSSNVNVNVDFSGMTEQQQTTSQPVMEEKPVEENHEAMTNSDFEVLLRNVENESFADDQLSVVRIAVKTKYFTIDQLIRLIDVFSFSEEKISCVRMVYPKVVDKDNAHNLLGAFTYSDDKKQVEAIISE